MSKGKILVTGGAGYIGSHTVVELAEQGYEPIILDNLSNSNIKVVSQIEKILGKEIPFLQLDATKPEAIKEAFSEHVFDGVIHFAAYKAVGESVSIPLEYYKNNLISLLNILSSAMEVGCKNVVFSSSCTVYGNPKSLPVTENAQIQRAISPYGNTKIVGEQILSDFVTSTDSRVVSLRYFNPIGAHKSSLIGELPSGVPNNLVPFITQTAIGKRKQLTVFGSDYNTPDGSCIRDYIHVTDLAKAHIKAFEYMNSRSSESFHDFFNIGTGSGSSVLEIIKLFEKISDVKLNYNIGPRRSGDAESVYGDTSKAEKLLHWKAEKTLEHALLDAWNWEKAYHAQQS